MTSQKFLVVTGDTHTATHRGAGSIRIDMRLLAGSRQAAGCDGCSGGSTHGSSSLPSTTVHPIANTVVSFSVGCRSSVCRYFPV
jgi:hypothetical protein